MIHEKNIPYLLSLAMLLVALAWATGVAAQLQISLGAPSQQKDTTKPPVILPPSAIKPYKDVVRKEYTSKKGLFSVHQFKDTVYFEIPDALLGQDVMVINRLTKAPAGHGMYAGEQVDGKTIFFERGKDSSIRIRYDLVINDADPGSAIYKAVQKSSNSPVVAIFPIKAYGQNSAVIDVSRFLKEKNFMNSVDPNTDLSKNTTVTAMKDFMIESIRAYPINVEIAISKTVDSRSPLLPAGTPATFETNTSFIALPEKPMQRRFSTSAWAILLICYTNLAMTSKKPSDVIL
ncbi:DUF5117 domain-containing protein [Niabella hibiscisoli]|nr:DUF5117 domain-containing protein [Niabella hibiscisoli]MCH5721100.1 DUF5117 domain-containing protein [Niabella hibiscisoli]